MADSTLKLATSGSPTDRGYRSWSSPDPMLAPLREPGVDDQSLNRAERFARSCPTNWRGVTSPGNRQKRRGGDR
jgi:hypothetical protein